MTTLLALVAQGAAVASSSSELTIGQLVVLGGAVVTGSFALNKFLLERAVDTIVKKVDSIEALLNGPNGVLVRLALSEQEITQLKTAGGVRVPSDFSLTARDRGER